MINLVENNNYQNVSAVFSLTTNSTLKFNITIISIAVKGSVQRQGGSPYNTLNNNTPLTKIGNTIFSEEGHLELWYVIDNKYLNIVIPNSNAVITNIVKAKFEAVSALSNKSFSLGSVNSASGVSSNPSVGLTPLTPDGFIFNMLFTGYRSSPTASSGTVIYNIDSGNEGYGAQYISNTSTSQKNMSWTQPSDDWAMIAVHFKEVYTTTLEVLTENNKIFTSIPAYFSYKGSHFLNGELMYRIEFDVVNTFNSEFLKVANSKLNVTTPADTSPFNSGEEIKGAYDNIPVMADGAYYVRCRAEEYYNFAGYIYGEWSEIRQFSINTTVAPTVIKSFNEIIKSSIKTKNSIASSEIKKWNELT